MELVYGGTFDPIHLGHLAVAKYVCELTASTSLRWLPVGIANHREQPIASKDRRFDMLSLALQEHWESKLPPYQIDRRDLDRPGPTQTGATLQELRTQLGESISLGWLGGVDSLQSIADWSKPEECLRQAHILMVQRPGYSLEQMQAIGQTMCHIAEENDIEIRQVDIDSNHPGQVQALKQQPQSASFRRPCLHTRATMGA